ncbi:hypothetical protein Fleli_0399 [Bernardetia litoralis DSM 6794]|uniref:Uncharacterized protein n=1 Tax=Bernardetia litoralis (strain ATCC 23117 / DSM 6794 / NBRC 15988 / NCIMB 1366 / Fx l1 / Sio-4) TaxID=880071 RepID=I4AFZ1_BERLS|nr:hypothetical protein [Bernardetia litoralis]AFM02876.1 hypothetical protein Fleli_0399 [Bernardetia litoralis DSM 6794]
MKCILVLLIYFIIFQSFSQTYYSDYGLEKEVIINSTTYNLDTTKGIYYFSSDSIYEYEPDENFFFNGMSLEDFETQEIEISKFLNQFSPSKKVTGLPRIRMTYQSFIDSISRSYEKLDNFSSLSKGEIYKAVTYSNIIDDAIFHNIYSDSTNKTYYARKMNLYKIPNIAKQYKDKFDSVFNYHCNIDSSVYEIERGTTKYLSETIGNISMNYKIEGTQVRKILIDFYSSCPIKSFWIRKNKLMTVRADYPSEFAFSIFIGVDLGTPEIIGWPPSGLE